MKNDRKWLAVAAAVLAGALGAGNAAAQVAVDKNLPEYKDVQGISGSIKSVGSDTLNNLMTFWAEGFKKHYPNVTIEIEGKGSTTAPPALIAGTATFGPMSRTMKGDEIAAFEKQYGYKPTALSTAIDMLAVYVNKDNPIQGLTFQQVDAIFSKTRKGGAAQDITTWGQLGLTGSLASMPISLYGRNSASGTYGFFKEHALYKGDYKDTVKEQPGSASVVLGVTEDKAGMGYSGIGYKTSGVKALALANKDGEPAYEPTYENVLENKYPLGRLLYVYVAKEPNKPLPPVIKEFLTYVLSKEGQEVVVKDGYLPLTAAVADKQHALIK